MLPNFLIIGAAKAGTTSLYHYVRAHPQAFMPERKELSFFCEQFNWNRGREWYESHFADAGSAVAVGEASPRYTVYPLYEGVPARVASLIPDARLIYLVREPIARMQSQYLDNVINGLEKRSIEEAVEVEPFYLTSSRYALQLDQYLEFFHRDRILVLRSEDMRSERERALARVFGFLEIDPSWADPLLETEYLTMSQRRAPRRFFHGIWHSPISRRIGRFLPGTVKRAFRQVTSRPVVTERAEISASFRHHLEDLLRDDVKRMREWLDEDFDGWGIA